MSDKKHIDRLFQEKFKDFEAKPQAKVWAGIQSKMEQPKEKTKTVLPFWLRFAGIAAALFLLLAIGNLFLNNEETENNTIIVNGKTDTKREHINSNIEKNVTTNLSTENQNSSEDTNNNLVDNEYIDATTIVTNDSERNTVLESVKKKVSNLKSNSTHQKGELKENEKNTNISLAKSTNTNNINSKSNTISANSEKDNVLSASNNLQRYAQSNSVDKTKTNATNNGKSDKTVNTNNNESSNSVSSKNFNNKNNIINNTLNKTNIKADNVLDNNNKSSDAVAATTNSEKEKEEEKLMEPDSANSSNTIEEILAKNEDLDEKEEEKVNRWSLSANAAPVYYNTLGKGSHIDDQFIDNPKNGEINTSYGINVGYILSDKLKIRSGINKLNLSYDTANVIVYENVASTPSSSPLRTINFIPNSQGQNISVLSTNSLAVQQISSVINDNLNAALSQRLSYLEVPLELEYAVVRNRFELNLISGFSTFFLNDNEVVTEVEDRKTKIGEANNVNNISFSANAGIGIGYKFSNAIKFNLEPTFKYQINAYSETSGNFKPYIIGMYTGISYKF